MKSIIALLKLWILESRLILRWKEDLLLPITVMVLTIFLGGFLKIRIDPQSEVALLWLLILMCLLLHAERSWVREIAGMEVWPWFQSAYSLTTFFAIRMSALFLITIVPLALTATVFLMTHLPWSAVRLFLESLLLGLPTVWALSTLGAVLLSQGDSGGLLLSLLIFPLLIPLLILVSIVSTAYWTGLDPQGARTLLWALLLPTVVVSPWLSSLGVKP